MMLELDNLWVSVWNSKTYGLRAMPINEALKEINTVIVQEGIPELHVIAVLPTLENCLSYNRSIKRIFKSKPSATVAAEPDRA
jgi:hypothetical protein